MSVSLLDHPLISQRYFFPRADRFQSPLLVEVDGAVLACAFHRVSSDALTVIHFHGNGEVASDWQQGFGDWLGALGFNVLLAEYRGYGMSTGAPQLRRMLDDVEPIARAAGVAPEELVFFGRSVGSLFAVRGVARFPEAAGLIIESGIADPLERLLLRVAPEELGATPEAFAAAVRDCLDPRAQISAYRGPTLILHSRHDGLVDVSHAVALASSAGGPVTLRIFEQGDHNSIFATNRVDYQDAVSEFLRAAAPRT